MKIRVRGTSMLPALRDGEGVEIEVFLRAPRIGEVVLYLDAGRTPILHRVIDRGRGWIRTAGDATSAADDRIPIARVLGVARVPARPWRARLRGLIAKAREAAALPRKVARHLRARRIPQ